MGEVVIRVLVSRRRINSCRVWQSDMPRRVKPVAHLHEMIISVTDDKAHERVNTLKVWRSDGQAITNLVIMITNL